MKKDSKHVTDFIIVTDTGQTVIYPLKENGSLVQSLRPLARNQKNQHTPVPLQPLTNVSVPPLPPTLEVADLFTDLLLAPQPVATHPLPVLPLDPQSEVTHASMNPQSIPSNTQDQGIYFESFDFETFDDDFWI